MSLDGLDSIFLDYLTHFAHQKLLEREQDQLYAKLNQNGINVESEKILVHELCDQNFTSAFSLQSPSLSSFYFH